jgi:2-polyprenyl-6-hydroxyphenyl methylase/3-demethylubiquinone-9 3-methyltransferase
MSSPPRFRFGRNWQSYLSVVDDARIVAGEKSVRDLLGVSDLKGKTFLDIGCGSGLFSLAATRLGASRVHSFDYDPDSVSATLALREQTGLNHASWTVERGDVLSEEYVASLGKFDFVYSWGVLHHTGNLWAALDAASRPVVSGGRLAIAIYNDQGLRSRGWTAVKRLYNRGMLGRAIVVGTFVPYFAGLGAAYDVIHARNPLRRYFDYRSARGMSVVHDWIDWLGGYPFEVAKPEQIFEHFQLRGFALERLRTNNGQGCNEFVFQRTA